MSLKLYISNDIDKLALKLASNIESSPLELYQKEVIVVQTDGMSSWISLKLAENNKVFSNFDFLSPNKLLFELFRIAGIYNSGIYDTNNLKWIIFDILDEQEFKSRFYQVYLYFQNDKIKQLQLATKIADLYDQYVIYRPDYIRLWNENKSPEIKTYLANHEKWQKWIWQKIKEKIGDKAIDKVQMRDALIKKFDDENFISKVKSKFPRISLFGFSLFTLFHIEVFMSALKELVDVDFYLTNPSPEDYWFKDIKDKTRVKIEKSSGISTEELKLAVGNQLLMNQGRTAKDLYNMLFDIDEIFNIMDNESYVNPPVKDSLLHTIQNEVYYNIPNVNRDIIPEKLLNDGSITIASNYTEVREVENLYSYLLKQIEENNYKLKDIIVQTSDIDLYTPIIKAVFDNAKVKIPYSIADRSYAGNDNLIGVLKQLLSLQKDEFSSEDILQLLDFGAIRRKFDISNIRTIRILVKMANIRHGINGSPQNDTVFVSWKYGLERILLGYAMKTDSLITLPNRDYEILPLEIAEGDFAKEGLKLKSFVDTLIHFVNKRSRPKFIAEWREYIIDFINQILEISDDSINDLNYIFDKLSFSDEIIDILDEKISYEVFSNAFIDSLYSNNRSSRFISGKITFCSMIPMRSIPYKVVAVLGLNVKTFPRKQTDISFDLIRFEHRKGDRNLKETDKYLFFETLLSAKEKLYLSYIGINIKDNSDLPPSPVLDELIDYISLKSEVDISSSNVILRHAIDNYDTKYYSDLDSKYYTYLAYGYSKDSVNLEKKSENKSIAPIKYIDFTGLRKFIENPVKWYFTKSLNINYYENSILLPETEIFELDRLEKYKLKSEIIKNKNSQFYPESIKKKMIKGELPLKNMASFELESTIEELNPILDYYNNLISGKTPREIEFELPIGENTIRGKIDNIFDNDIIVVNLSSSHFKSLAILKLISWICSAKDIPVNNFILLYLKDKKALTIKEVEKISKEDAFEKLKGIIGYFNKSLDEITPFIPLASYEYLRKVKRKSRKAGTPLEVFLKILDEKSKYDQYIEKVLEENIFDKFDEDENDILRLAQLFFDDEI